MNQTNKSRESGASKPAFVLVLAVGAKGVFTTRVSSHGYISSAEWHRVKMQALQRNVIAKVNETLQNHR